MLVYKHSYKNNTANKLKSREIIKKKKLRKIIPGKTSEKQEKRKFIILLKDYKSGHPNFLVCG